MLRLALVDENNNVVTDPDLIREYQKKMGEPIGIVHLTEDMLPRPGHGLPQYIPGCGWLEE